MANYSGPVRMVSKDGETTVVVDSPQQFNDLHFGAGYRIAEDQENVEPDPDAPYLDNGVLVDPKEKAAEAEAEASEAPEPETAPSTETVTDKPAEVAPKPPRGGKPADKVESTVLGDSVVK